MARLIDLIHGQTELRFCSALAILLQFEPDDHPILTRLLKAISKGWNNGKKFGVSDRKCPFSEKDLDDNQLENIVVQVEEPVEGRSNNGRLDLTIRFKLGDRNFLVAIEAKVEALGVHGQQLKTYRQQFEKWNTIDDPNCAEAESNRAFGLLTLYPEKLKKIEDEDNELIDFSLRWRDIREVIKEQAGNLKENFLKPLIEDFQATLRSWTMDLKDYAEAFDGTKEPPFPVLLDALENFCEKLNHACGSHRLNWDPPGWRGPIWDEAEENESHDGCYYCGAWWNVEDAEVSWIGFYLKWKYYAPKSPTEPEIKYRDGSGYTGMVEICFGRKGQYEDEGLKQELPLSHFKMLLSDEMLARLVGWIREGCKEDGNPIALA